MASVLLKKQKRKDTYTLKELKNLGHDLLSSRAHINNLPLLLSFIYSSSPPQYLLESLLSLQSFFTPLLPLLPPSASKRLRTEQDPEKVEDPEGIYKTWLRSKFDDYVRLLIDVLVSPETDDALREVVFDALMELTKLGSGGRFNSAIYHRFLHTFVHSVEPASFLPELLASKYFKYIDVRYFTYVSLEKLVKTLEAKNITIGEKVVQENADNGFHSGGSMDHSIHNIYDILSCIPLLEGTDENFNCKMWSGSDADCKETSSLPNMDDKQLKKEKHNSNVLSPTLMFKKMKMKFTKAWISFLRLPLPFDIYKEVLVNLHQAVIPHLSNPLMLCDFLTRSYDIGGVVSIMALSSLFLLMTQHGLEYPNFYEKLYALLVPPIFMAKHRGKFFQLLDFCLRSPLLPAYLAAAFAKKLSRLALSVPPSGALVIIALIHNLLRRHPSINCLVHREIGDETQNSESEVEERVDNAVDVTHTEMSKNKPGIDHFINEQCNPIKSNAMRSSLWEIDTLRHHYCPPVSRFVLALENDLTVRAKTTEVNIQDFCSGSYATIVGDEIRRRVKQVPLAFYKATPTSLFSESDFIGWSFKYKEEEENDTENNVKIFSNTCEDGIFAKRQRVESS